MEEKQIENSICNDTVVQNTFILDCHGMKSLTHVE